MRWTRWIGIVGLIMLSAPGHAAPAPGDRAAPGAAAPEAAKKSAKKSVRHRHAAHPRREAAGRHRKAQIGLASWYGPHWRGHRTASGERFSADGLTAAHRSLPLHSRALVTNIENGRSVAVRITDRGPHTRGRVIDLSEEAARRLGMLRDGVVPVRVEPLPPIRTAELPQ